MAFGIIASGSVGFAQDYPTRPIDIIAPFSAGGGVDIFDRNIREPLAKELKVAVNVVNRPGGSSVVGSSFVANARPDGYTLLGHDLNILLMCSATMAKTVPYNVLKDFTPIAQMAIEPIVIYVRSDSEFKTIEELISYAKKNPGKLLAGASGVATQNRVNLELLKISAGVDIRFVSFSGGGETLLSVLGGHTNISMTPLSVLTPHFKAGKLRPLAVCTPERHPALSQIPTMKEKGLPDVNVNMRFGLAGPKGLPPKITEKLANTVDKILKSEEVLSIFKRFGYSVDFVGPNQLSEQFAKDFLFFKDIAKKAKLEE